jgi:hypothetical protein
LTFDNMVELIAPSGETIDALVSWMTSVGVEVSREGGEERRGRRGREEERREQSRSGGGEE